MRFYQEIILQPDTECDNYFLWSKVYSKLHKELSSIKNSEDIVPIGVDFPEYNAQSYKLGTKLRLFALEEKSLIELGINKCLYNLRPYIKIFEIQPIPTKVNGYVLCQRHQVKSSNARLARRKAKRAQISLEEAESLYIDRVEERSELPYIHTSSALSRKEFRLYIRRKDVSELISNGFNTYGLSNSSTVPKF